MTACKHNPISILYMIYGFRIGGAERHLLDLCKRLDRFKFSPEIIYFYRDENMLPEFEKAGITCSFFPAKGNESTFREKWELSRVIKKRSPDIVHVHLYHASRLGAMAAYLAGIKRIVRTKHNVSDPEVKIGKRDRIWKVLHRFILSRDVAVSKAIARQINTPYVIYNGVDTDYFDPERASVYQKQQYASLFNVTGAPVIGIAARLTKQKGHGFLLKAFSKLLPRWPEAQLLIAGDGEQRDALESLSVDLGIGSNVKFLGSITNVREFLSVLDIFVHPSIFEGLGIAVIEAMSMGLPIVATKVDGLAELISNGVEGLLVEPADPDALTEAMNKIIIDPGLGLRLGRQARQKAVNEFSLKTMVEKYEELYLDLCQ